MDKTPPRIAYVTNARIPTEKAHGVQIMHTCEALAKAGAQVELVIPWRYTAIKDDPFAYYSVDPVFTIRRIPAIDVVFLGGFGFWIHKWSFFACVSIYLLCKRSLENIYVRGEDTYKALSFLIQSRRVFFESHIKQPGFEKDINLYKKAAGVTVVTRYYGQELAAAGFDAQRVLYVPDAVDLALFETNPDQARLRVELGLPAKKYIVGYVGKLTTMGHGKGTAELLEAFNKLSMEKPSAFLLIVGANSDELTLLNREISSAHISADSFKVVPHIPHAKALKYMQASDVLVMNYPMSAHYERYMSPLKLFEYMGSGTPIVTTDLTSVRDILHEDNATLVPPGDSDSLARALIHICSNPHSAREKAAQASVDVKEYTWEKRGRKILNFILSQKAH